LSSSAGRRGFIRNGGCCFPAQLPFIPCCDCAALYYCPDRADFIFIKEQTLIEPLSTYLEDDHTRVRGTLTVQVKDFLRTAECVGVIGFLGMLFSVNRFFHAGKRMAVSLTSGSASNGATFFSAIIPLWLTSF